MKIGTLVRVGNPSNLFYEETGVITDLSGSLATVKLIHNGVNIFHKDNLCEIKEFKIGEKVRVTDFYNNNFFAYAPENSIKRYQ